MYCNVFVVEWEQKQLLKLAFFFPTGFGVGEGWGVGAWGEMVGNCTETMGLQELALDRKINETD